VLGSKSSDPVPEVAGISLKYLKEEEKYLYGNAKKYR